MIRPLTTTEQRKVERLLPIATAIARKQRSRLTPDERASAAAEVLCMLVRRPNRKPLDGAALNFVVTRAINREWRRFYCTSGTHNGRAFERRSDRFWSALPSPPDERVELSDEAEFYRGRFHLLTDRQRECIELYCGGYRWVDIGEMMGMTKRAVNKLKVRIAEKLAC